MDTALKMQTPSLARRVLIWLRGFEKAMEMRPVDYLELRVADLERRIDALHDDCASPTARRANRLAGV